MYTVKYCTKANIIRQEWRSNKENSSKGLYYKLFKDNFEFEPYLDILTYKKRITFCKFRTGNHRIPIETGRCNGNDCIIYARMQR